MRLNRGPLATALAIVASLAAMATTSRAATLLELGLEDLVACADAIAVGRVIAAESTLLENGHVETAFRVDVATAILGTRLGERLDVRQLGGQVGDTQTVVPGTVPLAV